MLRCNIMEFLCYDDIANHFFCVFKTYTNGSVLVFSISVTNFMLRFM